MLETSPFLDEWKNQMYEAIKRINPSWDKDEIEECLDDMIKENIQLPAVILDNNYTGEKRDTNILSVFDWAMNRKPIIAGNGTFYKNQYEALNPVGKMLENFLSERKEIKARMFKIKDVESDQYKDLDRQQQNVKINANSYYGASGMPKSAFYSKYSGPATTCSAQSCIATTETFFEAFLADNYKFIDIDECFFFMCGILDQEYDIPDWIVTVTDDELYDRLRKMFYYDAWKPEYEKILRKFIYHLSTDEVTKIFYKNNLIEFTKRHTHVKDLYDKIFSSVDNYKYADSISDIPVDKWKDFLGDNGEPDVDKYNSFVSREYFMNPNNPPSSILEYLKELDTIYTIFVYTPYLSVDRIHRLKYFDRMTVCIVDTDSNILALDKWIEFCNKELLLSNYGRSEEYNTFIMINTLAYFITSTIAKTLDFFAIHSNIPKEYRKKFAMKNEFYFNKLIIGKKKKRYISSVKLREGNLIVPYKPDVKGFEFKKSTTSETAKAVFDNIIKVHILEKPVPDISAILHDLREFERDIESSIRRGELLYLPIANAKEMSAYKDPYSQQGVRGSIAWNYFYPGRQIEYPSKVSILKMTIFRLEDAKNLYVTHPEIYSILRDKIFGSSIEGLSSKGLQVLAIPGNAKIPEWCQPYIDINTVVNNIIGQFKGVLDVFSIHCPEVGKQIKTVNRKTKKFSNVVRF